jgi:hypothetical protein
MICPAVYQGKCFLILLFLNSVLQASIGDIKIYY